MDEQQMLTQAYQSNRLSHAYLFEGDDAESMKQVAMDFSSMILCDDAEQSIEEVANSAYESIIKYLEKI